MRGKEQRRRKSLPGSPELERVVVSNAREVERVGADAKPGAATAFDKETNSGRRRRPNKTPD